MRFLKPKAKAQKKRKKPTKPEWATKRQRNK